MGRYQLSHLPRVAPADLGRRDHCLRVGLQEIRGLGPESDVGVARALSWAGRVVHTLVSLTVSLCHTMLPTIPPASLLKTAQSARDYPFAASSVLDRRGLRSSALWSQGSDYHG